MSPIMQTKRNSRDDDDSLSRRRFLLGSLGAAGGAVLSMLPGISETDTASAGAWISRNYLYTGAWDLRYRYDFSIYGTGMHSPTSFTFESNFYDLTSDWAKHLNDELRASMGTDIDFVGSAGTYVNKPGDHGSAEAFDLTAIHFVNGDWVDMNVSWRHTLTHRRRYIAVACLLRCYFAEVVTAGTGDGHSNHIHFDPHNGSPVGLTTRGYDTHIIQRACNELNGESIAVDGLWGPQTDGAYTRLKNAAGMSWRDPFSSYWDMAALLTTLCRAGLSNRNV